MTNAGGDIKVAVPTAVGTCAVGVDARAVARDLQVAYPELLDRPRVAIRTLAERLGLTVRERDDIAARGRWLRTGSALDANELWGSPRPLGEVHVRRGLRDTTQRYVIAHEIAHAIAWRDFPSLLKASTAQQERFANELAVELLVPETRRPELRRAFRDIRDGPKLLKFADAVGISTALLLRLALENGWFEDHDQIWIDVRRQPNRYTGTDIRFRLWRVYHDRKRWYVPENQSLQSFLGDDEFVRRSTGFVSCRQRLKLTCRDVRGTRTQYPRVTVSALINALRLRDGRDPREPRVILGVTIDSSTARAA